MLIQSLISKNGQTLALGRIAVLVGPSNAGKSETLRDVYRLVSGCDPGLTDPQSDSASPTVVVHDVEYASLLTQERLATGLRKRQVGNETVLQGLAGNLCSPVSLAVHPELLKILNRPKLSARQLAKTRLAELLMLRVAHLDQLRRGALIESSSACSPLEPPRNLLQAMQYAEPTVHEELDAAFASAFAGRHLQLDTSEQVRLTLRVADAFPTPSEDRLETVAQFQELKKLDDDGDGAKGFVAVVLALLLTRGRLVLLDCPEANLAPHQALKLGRWIGEHLESLQSQVIVATHSLDFVAGLVACSDDVSVIRLSRQGDQTVLADSPAPAVRGIAQSPIISGQRPLESVFRDGIVVVEGDKEWALFQAVAAYAFPDANVGFLHAQGQRNLAAVVESIRQAGLPTCAVAYPDLLDSEAKFTRVVEAVTGAAPQQSWLSVRTKLAKHLATASDRKTLAANTKEVEAFLDQLGSQRGKTAGQAGAGVREDGVSHSSNGWLRIRRAGVSMIGIDARLWIEDLFDELKQQGLFVIGSGELSVWLGDRDKTTRPQNLFTQLMSDVQSGACPTALQSLVGELINYLIFERAKGEALRAVPAGGRAR